MAGESSVSVSELRRRYGWHNGGETREGAWPALAWPCRVIRGRGHAVTGVCLFFPYHHHACKHLPDFYCIALTSSQRQSRGRSSSSSRAAPAAAPAQSRSAHTAAAPAGYAASRAPAPPAAAAPAAGAQQQPGMMAQMAATAGSVAIGSTIGHGLSNMLFGGGQAAEAPPAQQQQQQQQQSSVSCEIPAKGLL